jgi:hypothetical protein
VPLSSAPLLSLVFESATDELARSVIAVSVVVVVVVVVGVRRKTMDGLPRLFIGLKGISWQHTHGSLTRCEKR